MNIFKKFLVFFAIVAFSLSFIACMKLEDEPSYKGWTMQVTAWPGPDADNKFDILDIKNNYSGKITFDVKIYNSKAQLQNVKNIIWTGSNNISTGTVSFPFYPDTYRMVFNVEGFIPGDVFTLKADFNGIISYNTYSFKEESIP